MILREDIEKREYDMLTPFAAKSAKSKGRVYLEEKCEVRTDFQRDRDRIVHSKAFRRLMHKTQVFLAPEGDHFRTRLTHTLEVSQIARTIARGLGLNEDLTEAIAMGHDLGHTPFGHSGESILNQKHPGGFKHNEQSLRVVEVLEGKERADGKQSMNLTLEVRDGILNHTGSVKPFTLEGQVVKISDRIAYINHDIDDAIRSDVITSADLPASCLRVLGQDHSSRINKLVRDTIENSWNQDEISMSEECGTYMNELRNFMFQNVYHNNQVKKDEDLAKVQHIIERLYDYYLESTSALPRERQEMVAQFGINEVIKDHIASMTDRYEMHLYTELFISTAWK